MGKRKLEWWQASHTGAKLMAHHYQRAFEFEHGRGHRSLLEHRLHVFHIQVENLSERNSFCECSKLCITRDRRGDVDIKEPIFFQRRTFD